MKLRSENPLAHSVTIPAHKPHKPGTLNSILTEVCEHNQVSLNELLRGL